MGRRLRDLNVTEAERATLGSWARKPESSQRLAHRARILLQCARGLANDEVADRVGTSKQAVCKWRERFRADRLQGLSDAPRSGPPRKITDDRVDEVVKKTLAARPKDATHWSVREMAAETGLSSTSIHRIWQTFGLQPHRSETFKLSTDPLFVEKVRDVVGLYMVPPERAIVLCVDEKSQVQAFGSDAADLPNATGGSRTANARLQPTWRHVAVCSARHRYGKCDRSLSPSASPSGVLALSAAHRLRGSEESGGSLVLDNYGTHKAPAVRRWFAAHPRFELHFTPTGASWLNQVERFFAEVTRRRIRRGTFTSVVALERAIIEYLKLHNAKSKPFVWTATADTIFDKIVRSYSGNS
jgi:transposase